MGHEQLLEWELQGARSALVNLQGLVVHLEMLVSRTLLVEAALAHRAFERLATCVVQQVQLQCRLRSVLLATF